MPAKVLGRAEWINILTFRDPTPADDFEKNCLLLTLKAYHDGLTRLHNAVDVLNGNEATATRLCHLCNADDYDGRVGVVHRETCPLLEARKLIGYQEAQDDHA